MRCLFNLLSVVVERLNVLPFRNRSIPGRSKVYIIQGYQKLTVGRNMPVAQSGTALAFLARGWLWAIKSRLDDAPQVNRTLR